MNFLESENILILIVGVIVTISMLVGAISLLYNKIVNPVCMWFTKTVKSIDKIDYIYSELRENGGHSIKDSVRRIEQKLVVNDERQRAFMRDYKYGILEMDQNGLVKWANRTIILKTGRPLVDLMGNGWLGFVQETDRLRISSEWDVARAQSRETNVDFNFLISDGTIIPVHMIVHLMYDAHGMVIGFLGLMEFKQDTNCVPDECPLKADTA